MVVRKRVVFASDPLLKFAMPALHGAETLVPPNTTQLAFQRTDTPVLGSASEATSGTLRVDPVWEAVCHPGLAS